MPMTLSYSAQVDKNQNLQGSVVGTIMGKSVMDCAVVGKSVQGDKADSAKAGKRKSCGNRWSEKRVLCKDIWIILFYKVKRYIKYLR